MSALWHIASFLVQHRPEAASALEAAVAQLPETQIAAREGGRSVLLCEGADAGAMLERVESLRQVEGVIGIGLVHHHAEDRNSLLEEIVDDHAS